ncbi:hypothetical protein [Pseudomonas huanghezhanensis]|uniref:hypothetical protein n=1 Tax=Pseudomonas huanghezhanensis TaxID=3002903 RepID=UPI002286711A|nr:hypothetical protein [Pseudomonas sp. BSw22131]
MQPFEIHPEDSQRLLCELNRATAQMMLIRLDEVGTRQWHEAQLCQQQAFDNWLRYLRRGPAAVTDVRTAAAA